MSLGRVTPNPPPSSSRSSHLRVEPLGAAVLSPPRLDPRAIGLPSKFSRLYQQQEDCILQALSSPKRFIGIFAPTASGKTAIYVSIALLRHDRAQINVHTKALQTQITNDFPSIFSITGHRNYCPLTVSEADADVTGCPLRQACRYRPEVEYAAKSQIIVTNYSHDFTIAKSFAPDRLGDRSLLILDEAHGIHDELTGQMTIDISTARIHRLINMSVPKSLSTVDWYDWSREAIAKCESRAITLHDEYESGSTRGTELRRLGRLSSDLKRFVSSSAPAGTPGSALGVNPHFAAVPYVVKHKDDSTGFLITPVLAKSFAEEFLFRGISKIILTSASIDRKDMFDLGIKPDDLEYIEVPSVIHPSRRKIYFTPTSPPTSLKHPVSSGALRLHSMLASEIVSGRLDRRGLIQTPSYHVNGRFLEDFKFRDIVITHGAGGGRKAVETFKSSLIPSVLVSPAVREGYDFPYEMCSYGIILKLPWPNTHDNPELAMRCKLDKDYRERFVTQQMEQMIGRIVRTPGDRGEIFIIDEQWGWFVKSAPLHQYVRDALVDCSERGRVLPLPPKLDYQI